MRNKNPYEPYITLGVCGGVNMKKLYAALIIACLLLCPSNCLLAQGSRQRTRVSKPVRKRIPTIDDEARSYAVGWWGKYVNRCGEYYYLSTKTLNYDGVNIYQIKYEPSVVMASGRYFPPRALSEADRLNGVDPQPMEWEGEVTLPIRTYRQTTANVDREHKKLLFTNSWGDWKDGYNFGFMLRKKHGEWVTTLLGNEVPLTFECSDLSDLGTPKIGHIDTPSSDFNLFENQFFSFKAPVNWYKISDSDNNIILSPRGGYEYKDGTLYYSVGVSVGYTNAAHGNIRLDTDEFVNGLIKSGPNMRKDADYVNVTIDGRKGLAIALSNVNEITRRPERLVVHTASIASGKLLYLIIVSPIDDFVVYRTTFANIRDSIDIYMGY